MMHVGIVRVRMDQRVMDVGVGMRFVPIPRKGVRMPVVLVV